MSLLPILSLERIEGRSHAKGGASHDSKNHVLPGAPARVQSEAWCLRHHMAQAEIAAQQGDGPRVEYHSAMVAVTTRPPRILRERWGRGVPIKSPFEEYKKTANRRFF